MGTLSSWMVRLSGRVKYPFGRDDFTSWKGTLIASLHQFIKKWAKITPNHRFPLPTYGFPMPPQLKLISFI